MKDLNERISNKEVLLADGAMGSLLMARGLQPGTSPESFNLNNINILEEIATLYHEAGAEIIQTNTFGGSPVKLASHSLQEKAEEINKNAVHAVRKAIGDNAYISASCGPSGRILKPYGDIEPDQLYDSFHQQLKTLIGAGVDLICIETMTDINESLLALKAARSISSSIPVIATMTFEKTPRGFYTIMGVDIKTAAGELEKNGASIIGSNCGNGIENMILIAREFKKVSQMPLIIQSNAGIPEVKGTSAIYPETPEFMAEKAKELIDIGVSVVGGCCGTTPDHIRALRTMIDSM